MQVIYGRDSSNPILNMKRLTPVQSPIIPARSKSKPPILYEAIYLDTETSHTQIDGEERGWIYQWALSFCSEIAYGRRPTELMDTLERIDEANRLTELGIKCVIYIHNLSYDMAYLKNWLIGKYGEMHILALRPHKFLSVEVGPWIFKCSYLLSNRSLAKWASDLGVSVRKKSGMIDYDVIRYQDSKLYRNDWIYMLYDVWTLEACVKKTLEFENDLLSTIPLTSTGYVRREARSEFKTDFSKNRHAFKECALTAEQHHRIHSAFAGGLTHGNRHKADERVDGLIRHRDFISHYPTQQMVKYAPIGRFFMLFQYDSNRPSRRFSVKDVKHWMRTHCLLLTVAVTDYSVKKEVTLPYMSAYKSYIGRVDRDRWDTIEDNGRILKATGTTVLYLTELDFKWLVKQMDSGRIDILQVEAAKKGPFPEWLRNTVRKYYQLKSELKVKIKNCSDEKEKADLELSYMKSKNMLNGIYGMTATNPVRQDVIMSESGEWTVPELTTESIAEKLEEYYKKLNSFMSYQFGVWTTAHARDELMTAVSEVIGYEKFLYADTDSAFYMSTPEVEARIDDYNHKLRTIAESKEAYAEVNGERVWMNGFELEPENITSFKFLHAKAYAFVDQHGLHATIAGVREKGRNKNTRVKELGSIDELRHGKVFDDCGGTRCVYNEAVPSIINVNGHPTEIASDAVILPVTKTLSGLIAKDEIYIEWYKLEDENEI